MSFDKTRAMRNAEKFLAQGKIGLAIGEFRQVVANDPRDFSTMNMLGDLYAKNAETTQAVDCYKAVAEHYGKQGFAQKAIAIYNKIARINPHSLEVMERLAELYREKGSIKESRAQYEQLAAHYERAGRKIEALAMWKHIAELDPHNAEAFVTIAQGFLAAGSNDDAASAFAEAGRRFSKLGETENAYSSFDKALNVSALERSVLADYIETAFACDKGELALEKLRELRIADKHDGELHSLQVDCFVRSGDLQSAEDSLVELLETDPACFPKLLDLGHLYIAAANAQAAARVLSMSAEHLLMDGRAEELKAAVTCVLEQEAEHVDALRMMVRCCSWLKDDTGFRDALSRLAEASRSGGSIDDERWALSQLVMVAPQNEEYAERLKEINILQGISDEPQSESLFDKRFAAKTKVPPVDAAYDVADSPVVTAEFGFDLETFAQDEAEAEISDPHEGLEMLTPELPADKLRKEVESIRFYIESGYVDIASKAIDELAEAYGEISEVGELRAMLGEPVAEFVPEQQVPAAASPREVVLDPGVISGTFDLNDLRNELGLDEAASATVDDDFETHYNTAVAYQEMYLLEESIKEFQHAISLVEPDDGTRRFFQCANLLGHCFMQLGRPNLAVRWFQRTLENSNISDDERLGIWYELAMAYDADKDRENAAKYFEQVYAENINFRDVSERVNSMIATV
jgi:tetratricopeptide (TPR) repeat protein